MIDPVATFTLFVMTATPTYDSYNDFFNYENNHRVSGLIAISNNYSYDFENLDYDDSREFNFSFQNKPVDYFERNEIKQALKLYLEIYGKEFEGKEKCISFFQLIYEKLKGIENVIFSISDKAIMASFLSHDKKIRLQSFFNLPDTLFMSSCTKNFGMSAMDCNKDDIDSINSFFING